MSVWPSKQRFLRYVTESYKLFRHHASSVGITVFAGIISNENEGLSQIPGATLLFFIISDILI